jgi:hypothetical protein
MWVFVGDAHLFNNRFPSAEPSMRSSWTFASGDQPLPAASIYVDLNGSFALQRPDSTPAEAWWMVHAPAYSLSELPPQTIRINGWPGFVEGLDWEVVAPNQAAENACSEVLNALGKRPVFAPDQIGGLGVRVLVSLINEAYLLMGEDAANASDIDKAMKLGTNYPMGPFEWAERIGLPAVYSVLKRLSETEPHYTPAPALVEAIRVL